MQTNNKRFAIVGGTEDGDYAEWQVMDRQSGLVVATFDLKSEARDRAKALNAEAV